MSKELTDKWRNGNIQETYYYVKCPWSEGEVDIRYVHNGVDDWKEIIAPVPSYDIFCALRKMVKNINRREMQLTIAIKALKEYERCENGSYASKALALIKEEE
jgi:hypothetical protein